MLGITLNKYLGLWSWISIKQGPEEEFTLSRIGDNSLSFKWAKLADYPGEQIYSTKGDSMTTPEDPSITGIYKDGCLVWYDLEDLRTPVAIWVKRGNKIFVE